MDPRSLDPEAVSLSRQCVKCDAPGILAGADSRKAVYCAPCFVQMVKHKFRSSLGKRRIYKDGASKETLLLFDGSLGSAFALGQLVESLEDTQHRKLMIEPTILFLIVSTNTARINEVLKRYMDISTSLSIPFRIAHVAAALQKNFDLSDVTQSFIGEDQLDRYSQLLSSMRTSTAKNEVKRLLIEVITARFAIASGIEKIWLPSTGDDLARNTIQFFSLGRGGNASSLISVTERRHGVNFLRPMHDCCDKEIRLVNQLEQYDAYCVNENEEPMNDLTSIHKVASNFIANLQREGFTATTTTLLSSTSKIVSGMIKTGISCRLCDEPMEKRDFDDSSNDLQVSFLCPSCLEIRSECENFDLFDSLLL